MDELENFNIGINCGKCNQPNLLITTCRFHHFILASICETSNCENSKSIYVVENGCPECRQQVHTTARMEAAMECVSIADSLGWDITPVAGGRGHDPMDWGVQIASEIRKHFGLEGEK